jgi:hypothetical protein
MTATPHSHTGTPEVLAFKKGVAPHLNTFELGQHGRNRTNNVSALSIPIETLPKPSSCHYDKRAVLHVENRLGSEVG